MKDLKKLVLADAAILSSGQMKKIKGGGGETCYGIGGSGTFGENFKCWCNSDDGSSWAWYGCWTSAEHSMWEDVYRICGSYDGTCDRV